MNSIDFAQALAKLAQGLGIGQQQQNPTPSPVGTPNSTGSQTRTAMPTQNSPGDASQGVATPVNQAQPQPQSPVDFNKVLQQWIDANHQRGLQAQDEAQQKLGIGKYEEGHPIRAFRHGLENLAGTAFELLGRRAPWLEEREAVMSPSYPDQAAQLQASGLGGQEMLTRMQEAQRQHDLMANWRTNALAQGEQKIQQAGDLGQQRIDIGQQRADTGAAGVAERGRHDVATEGQAKANAEEKAKVDKESQGLKQQMLQAALQKNKQALGTAIGNWKARIDSAMMSDEDKQKYLKDIQEYGDTLMKSMAEAPAGGAQQQQPAGGGSATDPLGIR